MQVIAPIAQAAPCAAFQPTVTAAVTNVRGGRHV
ncbi:hypothetical protein EDF71_104161 [Comamonas sp. JUb58]|nr:hypothetical protein EDF71_104161 [Comamonas sp. JUb58]